MPPPVVKEGDVLAGKYRVERLLGQGGMGQVVAAMHLQLKERVALKFLLPAAAAEPEFAARFQREAELMAKLRSEHVARVTDVGILETGAPYMVMEYLEGTDLRAIIRDAAPLPLDVAVDYLLQACEGLAEAHALGIVHRDVKPTNLFVTQRRDGSALVKVLDFGISKAPDEAGRVDDQLTGVAAVLGSPRYMPPEQLRSSRNVDARADVWAIAAIFQEMLTKETPFTGPNATAVCAAIVGDPPAPLRAKRPELPEALEGVLARAFAKEPEDRTPSVAAFAAAVVQATMPDDAAANLAVERISRMASGGVVAGLGTTTSRRYVRSASTSGSYAVSPAGPSSATPPPTLSGGNPLDTHPTWDTPKQPAGTSKTMRVAILAAVTLAIVAAFVVLPRREGSPASASGASSDPPPSPAAASTVAAMDPVPSAPPSTTAPPAPRPSASAAAPPKPVAVGGRVPGKKARADDPPAPPTPAPPPTPPPKEKPVGNPLEDRQ